MCSSLTLLPHLSHPGSVWNSIDLLFHRTVNGHGPTLPIAYPELSYLFIWSVLPSPLLSLPTQTLAPADPSSSMQLHLLLSLVMSILLGKPLSPFFGSSCFWLLWWLEFICACLACFKHSTFFLSYPSVGFFFLTLQKCWCSPAVAPSRKSSELLRCEETCGDRDLPIMLIFWGWQMDPSGLILASNHISSQMSTVISTFLHPTSHHCHEFCFDTLFASLIITGFYTVPSPCCQSQLIFFPLSTPKHSVSFNLQLQP